MNHAAVTGFHHLAVTVSDHAAFAVATVPTWTHGWHHFNEQRGVEHSGAISIPSGAILNFADPDGVALSIFWEDV